MNWHYVRSGESKGPVSDEEFQDLAASGVITASTLVWNEGMTNWQPYSQAISQTAPPFLQSSSGAAGLASDGGRICSQCGRTFPSDQVLLVGTLNVCAECKPAFIQKVKEGGELVSASVIYAGFWIRFAAKILDNVIMSVVNSVIGLILGFGFASTLAKPAGNNGVPLLLMGVSYGIGLALTAGYTTFFLGKFGATPGKMLCKIRVVTPEGGRITYITAFARFFGEIVSAMLCGFGYLMAAWDPERRALHDRMCNTRVVAGQTAL